MFQWRKRTPTENLSSPPDELGAAVRETVAPVPEPEAEVVSPQPKQGFFSRWFSSAKPEEKFLIQPKWARGAVKGCFWPMSNYVHPAWALTDEEAEKATPEMQEFLQALCDRYVPTILNEWGARHKEFMNVLLAIATLYYFKFCTVRALLLQEEAVRKVMQMPKADEKAVAEVQSLLNRPMLCAVCKTEFPNHDAYNAHLVTEDQREWHCPGKSPGLVS